MNQRIAIVAALTLTLVAGCGGSKTAESVSTSSSSSSAASGPTGSQSLDNEYIALLTKWANRDGYTLGNRATLIEAGREVCDLVSGGESVISASASLMDSYGLSGKQAQSAGVGAVNVLCPENKP